METDLKSRYLGAMAESALEDAIEEFAFRSPRKQQLYAL
jgi:hypothetical protein